MYLDIMTFMNMAIVRYRYTGLINAPRWVFSLRDQRHSFQHMRINKKKTKI